MLPTIKEQPYNKTSRFCCNPNVFAWRVPHASFHFLGLQWFDSLRHKTSTWVWHNMTWQHSFCCDPSYAHSCIANHGSNVLFMLQNIWEDRGCALPQNECEIAKRVTTGSAPLRSDGSSSRQRGLNNMLDRQPMTNVNQNHSMCPIE